MAEPMFKMGREAAPERKSVTPEQELDFVKRKLAALKKLETQALDFQRWKKGEMPYLSERMISERKANVLGDLKLLQEMAAGTSLASPEYDDPKLLEEILATMAKYEVRAGTEAEIGFAKGDVVVLADGKDLDHWKVLTAPDGGKKIIEVEKLVHKDGKEQYVTKLVRPEEIKKVGS